MSIRVGLDLVSVQTVTESLSAHGDHYLNRVYSAGEVADCRTGDTVDPGRLAARFAAKEAAFKVLRLGDEAVAWTDVEVMRDRTGWVGLSLSGRAATLAEAAGISELALSVSHEQGCAAAVVVAEVNGAPDT
ncbi:MAG: 4'-phosphopantetheinyl transferase superfamily protein [Solirubrobacteraceae bacterium]